MDDANMDGTTAGSAIQPWQMLALLALSPSAKTQDIAVAPADLSHQYTPMVYGSVFLRKDTLETLFYSWQESSSFWRWVFFQIYFFCSLGIVDSSALEKAQDRNI